MSSPFAYIMAPKDESEVNVIKKACVATMDLFKKYLQDQLMGIIDADKVKTQIHLEEGFPIAFSPAQCVSFQ